MSHNAVVLVVDVYVEMEKNGTLLWTWTRKDPSNREEKTHSEFFFCHNTHYWEENRVPL